MAVFLAAAAITAIGSGLVLSKHHDDLQRAKKLAKKHYNAKVRLYNAKWKELKKLEDQLTKKRDELIKQEEKLNNSTFQIERCSHGASKVVVCIGPTGYGKSLVCNRLLGNKKSIDDLEESKNEPFNVAELGEIESCTKDISKEVKKVNHIENDKKTPFILSVVDTPGAFDSDGQDEQFQNQMAEYFRASGGVNMFCIFFKFKQKIDQNYKKLLEIYEAFWGKDFWKHSVIVITKCDRDSEKNQKKVEKGLPKTKEKIRNYLKEKNVLDEIPIYEFGEDNFESSVQEIFSSLIDTKKVYRKKYKCDQIVSPIDKLWEEIKPMFREHTLLDNALGVLDKELTELQAELNL